MKTNQMGKSSTFSQVLLWFGAAVSIAEIQTGALTASLGFSKGFFAILLGHAIGAVILFLTGLIGAKSKLPAIESTRISFGKYGSFCFSILNVLQLLGWTAIMVLNGAIALDVITETLFGFQNQALWCVMIGLFIGIWVLVGAKNLAKINYFVISALFVLSAILGFIVFKGSSFTGVSDGGMAFGDAVELSVTMSLSWLPLISDYTRTVKNEKTGTLGSVLAYFSGSVFMFTIGLGSALYVGTSDIAVILMPAGFSLAALFIVLFSTVTTTFLDVYSAGVSTVNLNTKINEKTAALVTCVIGVVLAVFVPITQYENFLYLIGSVFAPLFAILLTEYFLLGAKEVSPDRLFDLKNTALWVLGVLLYRFLLSWHSPVGVTLPVMAAIGVLCVVLNGGFACKRK